MIITRDKIYNKPTIKLDATNSTLMDIGKQTTSTRRDEIIYLDFITNQLPDTLYVQLIDVVNNSVYLTQEGLEFGEINLQTAILQKNPPKNWGDKDNYYPAFEDCENKSQGRWGNCDEGLAIVQSHSGYHIYYMLHNLISSTSGINWKFGSGYIVYNNQMSEIYMTEDIRMDKSLKIGSRIQIDANGLQNISSQTEQNTFDFWNEDGIKYNSESIKLDGEQHHDWPKGERYFIFTNTIPEDQRTFLASTVSIEITSKDVETGFDFQLGGEIERVDSGTEVITLRNTSSLFPLWPYNAKCTFESGFITKLQMPPTFISTYDEKCTVTYKTEKIEKVTIPLLYNGTLYFHSSKTTSEEWKSGNTYSFDDEEENSWSATWDSGPSICLTPANKELSGTYKPTFSVFYSIGIEDNLIPILSPVKLTANYHEGKLTRRAIVAEGSTIKYYESGDTPPKKVLILAYVDVNE